MSPSRRSSRQPRTPKPSSTSANRTRGPANPHTYYAAKARALSINPLQNERYWKLEAAFDDTRTASQAMTDTRKRFIATITKPVEDVFGPIDAGTRVKILCIRRFIREHRLHKTDGRKARPFWRKLDEWYAERRREFGETFETVAWQRFVTKATEDDEYHAPPVPTPGVFRLHFISAPGSCAVTCSPPNSVPTSSENSSEVDYVPGVSSPSEKLGLAYILN
ncbi:hypothetical protein DFH06DRAFT_1120411 [Mycena polygramma]|nr:hypothetical protein DFH06DRAFT_1120411 [Mycena polygramma]